MELAIDISRIAGSVACVIGVLDTYITKNEKLSRVCFAVAAICISFQILMEAFT